MDEDEIFRAIDDLLNTTDAQPEEKDLSIIPYSAEPPVANEPFNGRLPDEWGYSSIERTSSGEVISVTPNSEQGRKISALIDAQNKAKNTKHYLYANMPLTCNGYSCPYRGCEYFKSGMIKIGDKCVKEITFLMTKHDDLTKCLGTDLSEKYAVDNLMISSLVYSYLLLQRCQAYLQENDVVFPQVVGVSESGTPITADEVNKALVVRDALIKKILKLTSELNASRKAKSADPFDESDIWDLADDKLKDYNSPIEQEGDTNGNN